MIKRRNDKIRELEAERDRLREGIRQLVDTRCNCAVTPMGGHIPSCNTRRLMRIGRDEYVHVEDLHALLDQQEDDDG